MMRCSNKLWHCFSCAPLNLSRLVLKKINYLEKFKLKKQHSFARYSNKYFTIYDAVMQGTYAPHYKGQGGSPPVMLPVPASLLS